MKFVGKIKGGTKCKCGKTKGTSSNPFGTFEDSSPQPLQILLENPLKSIDSAPKPFKSFWNFLRTPPHPFGMCGKRGNKVVGITTDDQLEE